MARAEADRDGPEILKITTRFGESGQRKSTRAFNGGAGLRGARDRHGFPFVTMANDPADATAARAAIAHTRKESAARRNLLAFSAANGEPS